jgi:hypothetical protein
MPGHSASEDARERTYAQASIEKKRFNEEDGLQRNSGLLEFRTN